MPGAASPSRAPRPARRTQAERSAETRARLLDATLDCLVERGWSGTTTTEVAERAGVSRGAELHHFPTRAELVAAAVRHLAERRLAEFARAVAALPAGSDPVSAGVDLLWSIFSDPLAYALLELVVAARTDEELRASLEPEARRVEERLARFSREIFPEELARSPRLTTLRDVAFLLLQGAAVQRIVLDEPERREQVLRFLVALSRQTLAAIGDEGPSRAGPGEDA